MLKWKGKGFYTYLLQCACSVLLLFSLNKKSADISHRELIQSSGCSPFCTCQLEMDAKIYTCSWIYKSSFIRKL